MLELLQQLHEFSVEIDQATSVGIVVGVFFFFWMFSDRHRTQALSEKKGWKPSVRIARVHNVLDGDTVIVRGWVSQETIRLDSIDCPEKGQHWGNIAKAGLIKMIGGKSVRIEKHATDKYQRSVATVYVWQEENAQWLNVNARMVTLGHAWVYRQFYGHLSTERRKELDKLEYWAQSKRVGLWRNPNPVPPWKWRMDQ